jgi:isoleucyl-tRNA synthetase
VRRVWGWDGHGLPIENKVEGELNIQRKKDIEDKIGVKTFIERCLHYVNEVSGEWEWYVDHIGRWVDFKHAYKTWDMPYMESVMWVFKQMYEKGYVYKGLRVSLYCPHCSTPISNFEVAMDADNYKEVPDAATTYKYPLVGEENSYILAWSTTPWNKIVTPALAVNPKLTYVKVKQGDETYILAESTVKILTGEYEVLEKISGKNLVGKKFVPHYDYYKDQVKTDEKVFEIIPGDFVTAEEGTGVVTIAAYGEEDLKVMKEFNIHIQLHVDEEGMIKEQVPQFGGMYYLKANKLVNEDLANRGLIYKDEEVAHNVPLCWRCHTRLYYAPMDAWFVNVQTLKTLMKETNETVNWFPEHFKHGRFEKSLENAPDWNISRNRYWGSPVPVWECECGERFVPGSIAELEERAGVKITTLHKPEIDDVEVTCDKCGKKVKRVPEVLDSWIEAGSASFAERHYPFEGDAKIEDFFPPDFIAEYTGQIRAWFYVLHVIGAALYKAPAFKNVVVEGVILGTDGRKMSKNLKNYPDPKELLSKYGGDGLRLYLLGSPVMHGEDIIISEEEYRNQLRGTLLILWNVYNFFVTYAGIDGWSAENKSKVVSTNVLDEWILALLSQLTSDVTSAFDGFDSVSAIGKINNFINDLSTWYLRRSRDRVGPAADNKEDKEAFYQTMYAVLTKLCVLMAPITPFVTEEIYRNLTGEQSVHLADWPHGEPVAGGEKLIEEMEQVRKIVEVGLSQRKEKQLKVRQPLSKFSIFNSQFSISDGLIQLIKDELNVKEVLLETGERELTGEFDTTITPELKAEGEARDIVRQIQEERKKLGTKMDEMVDVTIEKIPEGFEEYIKRHALVRSLTLSDSFTVTR